MSVFEIVSGCEGDVEEGIRRFTVFRKMQRQLSWLPERLEGLMESATTIRGGLMELESEADE